MLFSLTTWYCNDQLTTDMVDDIDITAPCIDCFTANCIPLLIQQNVDGSHLFFNRLWAEFKVGFNDSRGNYWLGNELLHQLTNYSRYQLRCVLQARSNNMYYVANYATFIVGSEMTNYTLTVDGYSGNAGDSMSYHDGRMFSTYDRDNDPSKKWHCARNSGAGFWYSTCYEVGVNHKVGRGFRWYKLPSSVGMSLKSVSMWLTC